MRVERGKHSKVYLIGPFAIKIFKKGFEKNASKEWKFLNLLKPYNFAPKPYFKLGRLLVMERINLKPIGKASFEEFAPYIPLFLKALETLDKLGIQKEECHRPNKHFLFGKGKVKLIDFERSHFSKKTHNVTQFLAFLAKFDSRFREIARNYSREKVLELLRKLKVPYLQP